MATLEDLEIRIGADTDDVEKDVGGLAGFVDNHFTKIAAAGVAAGASLEAFARGQADTNAALERVALASGESAEGLRESAAEMSNHTFAASDAVAGMERLTQSGITQQGQFEELLPTFDALADATGTDLVDGINSAERLLGPFGQGVEDVGDNVDQMTRLMNQTDVSLGSLERNLARVPNELQELGFGLDDAAAGVQVFLDKGFESKEAVREFRRAVEDSEGNLGDLLNTLGLSEQQWQEYQSAVEPIPGLTDQVATSNTDQMTLMERLQANVENLMFKYGGLAEAAATLAPILLALGPIAKGLVAVKTAWTAAQTKLNLALLANPLVLVIAAVAGLIAVVVLAWKRSEKFREIVTAAFDAVLGAAEAAWSWIKDNWDLLLAIITGPIGLAVRWVIKNWDKIKSGAKSVVDAVRGFFASMPGKIGSAIGGIVDTITSPFRSAFNGVASLWNSTVGRISFTVPDWVPGMGGRGFSVPQIPMLAEGGDIRGSGAAMVGEEGPEILDLPRGARVSPLDGGGRAGGEIVLTAEGEDRFLDWIEGALRVRGMTLAVQR